MAALGSEETEDGLEGAVLAHEQRLKLETKFARLQTLVCRKVQSRIAVNRTSFQQFLLYITTLFPPGDCVPQTAKISEIFLTISDHGLWDYWHYSPLWRVSEMYAGKNSDVAATFSEFLKELHTFKETTSLRQYMACCDLRGFGSEDEGEEDEEGDNPANLPLARKSQRYLRHLTMRLGAQVAHRNLLFVADLWSSLATKFRLPPTAILNRVTETPFCVTWLVPSYTVHILMMGTRSTQELFREHRIEEIIVDDLCIYEDEEVTKGRPPSKIKCPNRDLGCKWAGYSPDLADHLNAAHLTGQAEIGCAHISLTCIYCSQKYPRWHMRECPQRPLTCTYCGTYSSTYRIVVRSHWSKCELYPVSCPHCLREVPRRELSQHIRDCLRLLECPLGPDSHRNVLQMITSVSSKWYNIGRGLGLSTSVLNGLEEGHNSDSFSRLCTMLEVWLKRAAPPPTWESLARALEGRAVGERELAGRARAEHAKLSAGASGSTHRPSLRELRNVEVRDWFSVGLYLGFDSRRLQQIREDCSSARACRLTLFTQWLEVCVNPSYVKLVHALEATGEVEAASKLSQKYLS